MAYEPLKGKQLALKGISADDANPAIDDELPQNSPSTEKEIKIDNPPQNLEQEIKELREEIQKIRNENEARKKLEVPEEEKGKSVDDILSAVGRQYSLLKQGTIGLSYNFNYTYHSGDTIDEASVVERRYNHNLTNTITAEYALKNNITLTANVPFCYKYNKVGTSSSQDTTDLGDISLGVTFQPFKAGGKIPTTIFSLAASIPTGSSPYEINLTDSMSTGSGYYAISGGVSLSKVIDPLVAFGSLSYTYGLEKSGLSQYWSKNETLTKVEPGSSIGLSLGFGYALSYQASLNLSAQFAYSFTNRYTVNDTNTYETGTYLSSSFNVGTGWRITPSRSLYISLGIGLTVNDPDVSVSFRVPFEF
jgi:hypothetical protein